MGNVETFRKVHELLTAHGYPNEILPYAIGNRASSTAFTPRGMMSHYTASNTTSDRLLFVTGNGHVKGPLAHWTIERDGYIKGGATGYTNNAGYNDPNILKELSDFDVDALGQIAPGKDTNFSLNRYVWACETKAASTKTAQQYRAECALWAAVVIAQGWDSDPDRDGRFVPLIGHKEATRRKADPVEPMDQMRAHVAALVAEWKGGPAANIPTSATGLAATTPSGSSSTVAGSVRQIAVDGLWGMDTSTRLQEQLGMGVVDGYISRQWATYRAGNPGLLASSWRWDGRRGDGGSPTIAALQGKVGATADGVWGPNTCKAVQRYLGTYVDGKVSGSGQSTMVRELQRRLNEGRL